MKIPQGAAEFDDRPATRRPGLPGPAAVARSFGWLADVGRQGLELLAMALVVAGAGTLAIAPGTATFRIAAIAALGAGCYLLGQLHAPRRPGERDIAIERAVLARERADLNRVLVAFAVRGSDGRPGDALQVAPRSAGSEPRAVGVDGRPPRRLGLVDLELTADERASLDQPLEGELDDDTIAGGG